MCDQSDITCNGQPRFTQIPNNIPTSTRRNLDNNNITSINSTVLSGLTSLNRLSLRNNQISSIDSEAFSGISLLRYLRLGGNKITSIASVSSGITSLYKLDLSDNYISSIEPGAFSGFTSLFEIELQGNRISSITADAFANLTTLSVLDLQGNTLSYIEPGAFKGQDWEYLYLNNNNLTTVSANLFDSTTSLDELTLQGNPLMCCTMLDLIEWTKNQTKLELFTGTCYDFNTTIDINSFNSTNCPVDGEWGSWMSTPCSTSCGNGSVYRKRRCDSPAPSKGGQMCVGDNMEYLNACNLKNCP
ncbi:Hypothetical predicted protein, partial [Mytilus galloprovincialis]